MKLIDFLKDKSIILFINIILFAIAITIMVLFDISFIIMLILGAIWFLPLLSYIIFDYIKYKKYFNNINNTLDSLDKKYLLPEVLEEEDFLIANNINSILKTISRDMHENVKYYKDIQIEYREYIEGWVHEIKTPIASSKLIIENNYNEATKKIDYQLEKIEGYVEQALYYSRSDEVSKDYIIKEVNIDTLVRNVIKRNYRDFIYKKIKIDIKDLDGTVYSDGKWIEFILNQIISNSIKYASNKDPFIKIYSVKNKNSMTLIIEDNGIGILEKDINRVFEKGFTGENGRIFTKSTGMGLYLCRKLCKKLGLEISIESEVNKGTIIKIKFPLDKNIKSIYS